MDKILESICNTISRLKWSVSFWTSRDTMFIGLSMVNDSGHVVLIKKKASTENGPRDQYSAFWKIT